MNLCKGYIVFPDTHGHFDEVLTLLRCLHHAGYTKERRMVFLGDLLDRGPHVRLLLELVIRLQRQGHICIAGNHEYTLRMALNPDVPNHATWVERWANKYEDQTLKSYGLKTRIPLWQMSAREKLFVVKALKNRMPVHHQAFLNQLPLFFETENHIFIHAGLTQSGWNEQKNDLHDLSHPRGPAQIFSCELADAFEHPSEKIVVSGHTVHSKPHVGTRRIQLHCGVEVGGPLVVWISDIDKFLKLPPSKSPSHSPTFS